MVGGVVVGVVGDAVDVVGAPAPAPPEAVDAAVLEATSDVVVTTVFPAATVAVALPASVAAATPPLRATPYVLRRRSIVSPGQSTKPHQEVDGNRSPLCCPPQRSDSNKSGSLSSLSLITPSIILIMRVVQHTMNGV
jgi:hypothetical protein